MLCWGMWALDSIRIAEWLELELAPEGHLAQLPSTNRDSLKPVQWGFVFSPSAKQVCIYRQYLNSRLLLLHVSLQLVSRCSPLLGSVHSSSISSGYVVNLQQTYTKWASFAFTAAMCHVPESSVRALTLHLVSFWIATASVEPGLSNGL